MSTKTIKEILGNFSEEAPEKGPNLKHGRAVTIWLPLEAKQEYDRLQKISNRGFSKKAREALLELINAAVLLAP